MSVVYQSECVLVCVADYFVVVVVYASEEWRCYGRVILEAYKCNTNVWREYVPGRGGTTVLCCQGTILIVRCQSQIKWGIYLRHDGRLVIGYP